MQSAPASSTRGHGAYRVASCCCPRGPNFLLQDGFSRCSGRNKESTATQHKDQTKYQNNRTKWRGKDPEIANLTNLPGRVLPSQCRTRRLQALPNGECSLAYLVYLAMGLNVVRVQEVWQETVARPLDKNDHPAREPWFCNLSRGKAGMPPSLESNEGRYLPTRYLNPTPRIYAQKSITPKQVNPSLDPQTIKSEFSNLALIQTGAEKFEVSLLVV